jgi:hypothetical protein
MLAVRSPRTPARHVAACEAAMRARQARYIAQKVGWGLDTSARSPLDDLVMIQPQVHLRLPCYDFYFL